MNEIELIEAIKKTINSRQINLLPSQNLNFYESLKRLGIGTLRTLYFYCLSEEKELAENITYFLSMTGDLNVKLENYVQDPVCERIYKKAKTVSREIHRMKGLLRFREILGGYLYASFCPDFNIILPIARHFAYRLRNDRVIIHDLRRNLAVFCHLSKVYMAEIKEKIPSETQHEIEISKLWLKYFERISIKERLNYKIQKQKVPLKYRATITEFKCKERH